MIELFGSFLPWATTAGFLLAAGGFILWRARAGGAAAERRKREAIDRIAARKRDEIEDAVAGRSPGENRGRLGKWARD